MIYHPIFIVKLYLKNNDDSFNSMFFKLFSILINLNSCNLKKSITVQVI